MRTMRSNQQDESYRARMRLVGAILRAFGTTPTRPLDQPTDSVSPLHPPRRRRQMRRWLQTNGLIIVVVSMLMVLAWMIATG